MASCGRLQRRMALRRKLHILRTLTGSKSVKKSSVIMDALLYIYKLRLKLEAIVREYSYLMAIKREYIKLIKYVQVPKEVNVDKIGEAFLVKVRCTKEGDMLVSILEAFEDMGLDVLQANVSCNSFFAMEAIVAANDKKCRDVRDISQSIIEAIERQVQEDTCKALKLF
ncbi:hypothetical protein CFOL_v3_01144 [Cephalotus follicularis]|uniref:Plant bHLH transcription factor ACT-like domain-containing protein n=1 Tax=Cephalotus follicularis TaxID=3775 RepID=A0A1Q3APC9_CEPFO|nr:hypothetical protein CFOL_v3_01144 [Cephalotus follicularis]